MQLKDLKISRPRFRMPGRLVCPQCGEQNADEARTCQGCGQGLYVSCSGCAAVNLRSRSCCRMCGHHLRNTVFRQVKRWLVDRHGGLLLKILLVLGVSYFTSKVIIMVAQMGGGNSDDEGPPVTELPAEPGMAAPMRAPDPEPDLPLFKPAGKKK